MEAFHESRGRKWHEKEQHVSIKGMHTHTRETKVKEEEELQQREETIEKPEEKLRLHEQQLDKQKNIVCLFIARSRYHVMFYVMCHISCCHIVFIKTLL
jgi:hypothetical protein